MVAAQTGTTARPEDENDLPTQKMAQNIRKHVAEII